MGPLVWALVPRPSDWNATRPPDAGTALHWLLLLLLAVHAPTKPALRGRQTPLQARVYSVARLLAELCR